MVARGGARAGGKVSLAAKVTADNSAGTIALEDFANQRAVLNEVRRETT